VKTLHNRRHDSKVASGGLIRFSHSACGNRLSAMPRLPQPSGKKRYISKEITISLAESRCLTPVMYLQAWNDRVL